MPEDHPVLSLILCLPCKAQVKHSDHATGEQDDGGASCLWAANIPGNKKKAGLETHHLHPQSQ